MPVTLQQSISAYSPGGARGHIDVTVTGTNEGRDPILNSSGALGFLLQDRAGHMVAGFHRIPPGGPDMGGLIPQRENFERTISFDTGPVNLGQEYILTCRHMETGDYVQTTFTFIPTYLGSQGMPGAGFDQG